MGSKSAEKKAVNLAVVGATGLVGREILTVLEERGFNYSGIKLLASTRSAGEFIQFDGSNLRVEILDKNSFTDIDIVLMSAGSTVSKEFAPIAAKAGAVVIDNSSCWRQDSDVPLVVPEVNAKAIAGYKKKRIIANPNCSTIQMVVALKPLHDESGLKRIVVSTYQAVSGAGKQGMDELGEHVQALFTQADYSAAKFPRGIAFNCIPEIDLFEDDMFTKEEHKMHFETRKIFDDESIGVCATCVRVPVFNGHAESINAEFHKPLSTAKATELIREGLGLMLQEGDNPKDYPTQSDVSGSDATFVGRIRKDPSVDNGIVLWCVADNLRKGAATNAVQIAELLQRDYL